MEYGYNLAASGMLTAMYRQDVASNNLANIETAGFKPDRAFTIPRAAARVEDKLFDMPSNRLLERLGAGVLLGPTRTSFDQGGIARTGNPLDVAIQGSGFLTVAADAGRGPSTPDRIRLTRDGRMTVNQEGLLVTSTGGRPVLDENSRPITLDRNAQIDIDGDGVIRQEGSIVARLRLVDVPNATQLRKLGEGLYAPSTTAVNAFTRASGELRQGHVEQSGVDPILAMMEVQNAANAVTTSGRMLSIHDELTGRLINSLGRASA